MSGLEWIVEAHGCSPDALRDLDIWRGLFQMIIADLGLHTAGDILWRQFPNSGGITGLALLSESHLACHTFPEHGSVCLNLFTCRPRRRWDFETQLRAWLGAEHVTVRNIARDYIPARVEA